MKGVKKFRQYDPLRKSKPATQKQTIARERNWNICQIKGAAAQLKNAARTLSLTLLASDIEDIEVALLRRNEYYYHARKLACK